MCEMAYENCYVGCLEMGATLGKCHRIRASRALLTSEFQFTFFSIGLNGHPAHFVELADD